jgi:hypothetical protein
MKEYIKIILINLLPSIFIFLGRNTYLFEYFQKKGIFGFNKGSDIIYIQTYFFFIGIVWVGLIFPLRYAYVKKKQKQQNLIHSELIEYNKKLLFKYPQTMYKTLNTNFNTRIFVPKKGILSFLKKSTTLVPQEYSGLTNKLEEKKLNFCVNNSTTQGMVGKSFKEKEIFIDFDMSNQNKYELTENQKRLVRDAKFCSTIPILDNNNQAIAVLAVDSNKKIKRTQNIEYIWKEHLIEYASFVTKNIKI